MEICGSAENPRLISGCSAVDSARDLGSRGREFESHHSDHSLLGSEDMYHSFPIYIDSIQQIYANILV